MEWKYDRELVEKWGQNGDGFKEWVRLHNLTDKEAEKLQGEIQRGFEKWLNAQFGGEEFSDGNYWTFEHMALENLSQES
jgi:hypothetical protein